MLIYKPYEISSDLKAAADRFALAVEDNGISNAVLMVSGGGLSFIDIQQGDEAHFLKWIKGVCYELEEVDKWEPTTNH